MRSLDLAYAQADQTGMSLLARITLTGHRGTDERASLPPQVFTYTRFTPGERRIVRFNAAVSPPPPLEDDVTLVDFGGTALPGILRLGDTGATYWENRGGLKWGPPRALRDLPSGVSLSEAGVRFADMEGRGNADLVVGRDHGAGYYPNRAGGGFERKRTVAIAPSFDLTEDGSYLIDLDGDRIADLLTFRNGRAMAFLNRGGAGWEGPAVLGDGGLPRFVGLDRRLRMADMNGDGMSDLVLLRARRITYWPYLGNGHWGDEREMAGTPDFTVPNPDADVMVADVNGDGAADLVLIGASAISIYINKAGEGFADPIVLNRTPRIGSERVLLADMMGTGSAGLLFTTTTGGEVPVPGSSRWCEARAPRAHRQFERPGDRDRIRQFGRRAGSRSRRRTALDRLLALLGSSGDAIDAAGQRHRAAIGQRDAIPRRSLRRRRARIPRLCRGRLHAHDRPRRNTVAPTHDVPHASRDGS